MKIFELLRNPIIKIVGVILVLYFALFHDKRNPESLGNRLSGTSIKRNFGEIQEKSKFIISNVNAAKEVAKEKKSGQSPVQNSNIKTLTTIDIEDGDGEEKLSCGDEATISYGIYNVKNNQQLDFIDSEKVIIGGGQNLLLEKNIADMKRSGIRSIVIPRDFNTGDKKLMETLKFNDSDIKYQVTVLGLKKAVMPDIICN